MTSPFLSAVLAICLAMLALAIALTSVRVLIGPSLPDRLVGLDLVAVLSVGVISLAAIDFGTPVLIDVALVLALITFLGTMAFARYIERRGRDE